MTFSAQGWSAIHKADMGFLPFLDSLGSGSLCPSDPHLGDFLLAKTTSLVAQIVKNLPAMREICVQSLGRNLEEGSGNPLQYSCLENSMDRGTWQGYSPWGQKELDTIEITNNTQDNNTREKYKS